MHGSHKKPPLGRVAANIKSKNSNAANLKQFYSLRKEIIELRISIDKLYQYAAKSQGGHL